MTTLSSWRLAASVHIAKHLLTTFLAALWLAAGMSFAGRCQPPRLPEGPGLAAKYPGDAGIGQDRAVVFAENFEADDLREILRRWSDVRDPKESPLALVDDVPPGSAGKRSLRMTAIPAKNTGAHLYKRLPEELDTVFARFYVKFPKPAGYIHHFVTIGGYRPATNWPQGGAGTRPRGDDRITVGIEPFGFGGKYPPPGLWNFYVYWHEMKPSAGGRFWGNGLQPVDDLPVPVDRWQCVEVMIRLNSEPQSHDGELALWLDGKLVAHFRQGVPRSQWTGMGFRLLRQGGTPFEGFNWRTDPALKINFFWLMHYVTADALRRNQVSDLEAENRVLFDQIVVAREYVGPIVPATSR